VVRVNWPGYPGLLKKTKEEEALHSSEIIPG